MHSTIRAGATNVIFINTPMIEDKYQITIKSYYINLLLLKDELQHFDKLLSEKVLDSEDWLNKLRATRSVFLTLNNVRDAADRIQIKGNKNFIEKTRKLKKELLFANHFRNRGIGHLNDTLLKRAVQWQPQIFFEGSRGSNEFQLLEAQRAIIESCINSFIDKNGNQKIFNAEIDLMYPPDARLFFTYLSKIINETIDWLSIAIATLIDSINYHKHEEIQEIAAIAGQTNFDLKSESNLSFSPKEMQNRFINIITELEQQGVDPKILDFLREKI